MLSRRLLRPLRRPARVRRGVPLRAESQPGVSKHRAVPLLVEPVTQVWPAERGSLIAVLRLLDFGPTRVSVVCCKAAYSFAKLSGPWRLGARASDINRGLEHVGIDRGAASRVSNRGASGLAWRRLLVGWHLGRPCSRRGRFQIPRGVTRGTGLVAALATVACCASSLQAEGSGQVIGWPLIMRLRFRLRPALAAPAGVAAGGAVAPSGAAAEHAGCSAGTARRRQQGFSSTAPVSVGSVSDDVRAL